ncbi:hypothetical protein CAEBREN_17652 [Caenorhabditis brenneri]|uniref:Uncharacterized protein n=1 Tax=Caenorhabditis brenneri TaxID=135651 RepID=G0MX78_CAEBE|nr:hypothetical protein CAEBREN_17652 [Caenorhabditis brenneri]
MPFMETGPRICMGSDWPNPLVELFLNNLMVEAGCDMYTYMPIIFKQLPPQQSSGESESELMKETGSESSGQKITESSLQKKKKQAVKAVKQSGIYGKKEDGYSGDVEEETSERVVKVQTPRGELIFNGVCYDDDVKSRLINHIEIIDALDNFDSTLPEHDDFFFIGPLRMHHDRMSCYFTDEEINELVEDLRDFVDERLDEFYKKDELNAIKKVNRFTLTLMRDLLTTHQNAVVISELFYLVRGNEEMGEEDYNQFETMFLQAITCIVE